MENATKALEIAGGVLISLLVIGVIVYFYNNLSSLKQTEENSLAEQQATDFNKDYETYNRDDVYGSELLSLANKMHDYNYKESDNKGYEKIEMSVKFNDKIDIFKTYYGNKATYTQDDLTTGYTNLANEIRTLSKKKVTALGDGVTKTYSEWTKLSKTTLKSTLSETDYNSILHYQDLVSEQTDIARKTFKCTNVEYKNSRIIKMTFTEN